MPYSASVTDTMPSAARLGVMCIGDSITVGTGSPSLGGYRMGLFTQMRAHLAYSPKFVGSNDANSFIFNCCATAGFTSAQILTSVQAQSPIFPTTNIYLIHAGTNDVLASTPTATTTGNILSMIAQIRVDNPNATIWVADIIDRSGFTTQINTFNPALTTAVQGIASYSATNVIGKTMMVDINAALGPYNVTNYSDVTHPNAIGYALVTMGWYNQIITLF